MTSRNPSWYTTYQSHALPETQVMQDEIQRIKHSHHKKKELIVEKDEAIQKVMSLLKNPKTIEKQNELSNLRHENQKCVREYEIAQKNIEAERLVRVEILQRIVHRIEGIRDIVKIDVMPEDVPPKAEKPLHFPDDSDSLFYAFLLEDAKFVGARDDSAGMLLLKTEKELFERAPEIDATIENRDALLEKYKDILTIDTTIQEEKKVLEYMQYSIQFLYTCIKGDRELFCVELKKILEKIQKCAL